MMKKLAVTAISTIAVLALAAGPASASSTYYLYYGGVYRGYGSFQSYGDVWTVCDERSDGRGVFLEWYVPSTDRYSWVWDRSGADGVCAVQNPNIGEGRTVQYQLCLTDGVVLGETCGGWRYDTA